MDPFVTDLNPWKVAFSEGDHLAELSANQSGAGRSLGQECRGRVTSLLKCSSRFSLMARTEIGRLYSRKSKGC